MRLKSNIIFIDNLRLYAHHGVMKQEQRVGGWFLITLRVHYNMYMAMKTDNIKYALSYADVVEVVKEEMAKPSSLLEHVAARIVDAIFERFPRALSVDLKLTKENPPMGVDCSGAGVDIRCKRDAGLDSMNSED